MSSPKEDRLSKYKQKKHSKERGMDKSSDATTDITSVSSEEDTHHSSKKSKSKKSKSKHSKSKSKHSKSKEPKSALKKKSHKSSGHKKKKEKKKVRIHVSTENVDDPITETKLEETDAKKKRLFSQPRQLKPYTKKSTHRLQHLRIRFMGRPHIRPKSNTTWMEVFYDLCYVSAVATIVHYFEKDISGPHFGSFCMLFTLLWWTWTTLTSFINRFETSDLINRTFTYLQMTAGACLAVTVYGGDQVNRSAFTGTYVFHRWLLALMYLRVAIYLKEHRYYCLWNAITTAISGIIFICSIPVPYPYDFILWCVSFAFDVTTHIISDSLPGQFKNTSNINIHHIPERFGLFIIIILGESVIATSLGGDKALSGLFLVLIGINMITIISFWWIYFDEDADLIENGESCAIHALETTLFQGKAWYYAHLPLAGSLSLYAAGMFLVTGAFLYENDYTLSGDGGDGADGGLHKRSRQTGGVLHYVPLTQGARWVICGSAATYWVCMSIIHMTHSGSGRRLFKSARVFGRLLGAVVVGVVFPLLEDKLSVMALMGCIAGVSFFQILVDLGSFGFENEDYHHCKNCITDLEKLADLEPDGSGHGFKHGGHGHGAKHGGGHGGGHGHGAKHGGHGATHGHGHDDSHGAPRVQSNLDLIKSLSTASLSNANLYNLVAESNRNHETHSFFGDTSYLRGGREADPGDDDFATLAKFYQLNKHKPGFADNLKQLLKSELAVQKDVPWHDVEAKFKKDKDSGGWDALKRWAEDLEKEDNGEASSSTESSSEVSSEVSSSSSASSSFETTSSTCSDDATAAGSDDEGFEMKEIKHTDNMV